MTVPLFLLVFAVCVVVIGSVLAVLMLAGTPRYRTEPEHLLALFDRALGDDLGEDEWNATILYPIRHSDYLDGVRRRARQLMEDHGRFGRLSRNKSLLDKEGTAELKALRDHLNARTQLERQRVHK